MQTNGPVEVKITCHSCHKEQPPIEMTHVQLLRWRNGEHIQNVLPDQPPAIRELMISGVCDDCFQRMFS